MTVEVLHKKPDSKMQDNRKTKYKYKYKYKCVIATQTGEIV